jgi:hypothetical protein
MRAIAIRSEPDRNELGGLYRRQSKVIGSPRNETPKTGEGE